MSLSTRNVQPPWILQLDWGARVACGRVEPLNAESEWNPLHLLRKVYLPEKSLLSSWSRKPTETVWCYDARSLSRFRVFGSKNVSSEASVASRKCALPRLIYTNLTQIWKALWLWIFHTWLCLKPQVVKQHISLTLHAGPGSGINYTQKWIQQEVTNDYFRVPRMLALLVLPL